MKGVDLYSWKSKDGGIHYALLDGTNRLKTPDELVSNQMNIAELEAKMKKLPEKSDILWNNTVGVDHELELNFAFPSRFMIQKITNFAHNAHSSLRLAPKSNHDVHL